MTSGPRPAWWPCCCSVLWSAAVFKPLPYVTYEPGPTLNVLGENDGEEIIQVSGHKTYRDGGELRMTTVLVSTPRRPVDLFTLMTDWINPEDAVYPYDAVYAPEETTQRRTARRARSRWSPRRTRRPRRRCASSATRSRRVIEVSA